MPEGIVVIQGSALALSGPGLGVQDSVQHFSLAWRQDPFPVGLTSIGSSKGLAELQRSGRARRGKFTCAPGCSLRERLGIHMSVFGPGERTGDLPETGLVLCREAAL